MELKTEEITPFQQAANQVINDLNELFFEKESMNLLEIELIVLENLNKHFPKLRVGPIAGVSVRTVRNKLNGRI